MHFNKRLLRPKSKPCYFYKYDFDLVNTTRCCALDFMGRFSINMQAFKINRMGVRTNLFCPRDKLGAGFFMGVQFVHYLDANQPPTVLQAEGLGHLWRDG